MGLLEQDDALGELGYGGQQGLAQRGFAEDAEREADKVQLLLSLAAKDEEAKTNDEDE